MNIYAFMSILGSPIAFCLGIFVYFCNPKSRVNRVFMYFCLSEAYWCFAIFLIRQAPDINSAKFYTHLDCLWPIAVATLMHFVLLFTGRDEYVNRKWLVLLYAPAIFFIFLDAAVLQTDQLVKTSWGWKTVQEGYISNLNAMVDSWGIALAVLSLFLCLRYYLRDLAPKKKQQARFVLIGLAFLVSVGALSESILPAIFKDDFPGLSTTVFAISCIPISYGIWRYELFSLNPVAAADKIVYTMADALFICNQAGQIITVNPAALTLLGYRSEELVGESLDNVIVREEPIIHQFRRLARGKEEIQTIESPLRTRDGKAIHALHSIARLKDNANEVAGFVLISKDIGERKFAEEALREERDRAQKYFNIADTILVVLNRDQTISQINKKGVEVLGYLEEEIIGKGWFETFVPEERRKAVMADFQKILDGDMESVEYYENTILTKSGEERLIAWHNTYIRGDRGEIIATLSSGEDITDRKAAETALRENEERYRTAIESSIDGVAITGGDRLLLFVNGRFAEMFGYKNRDEVIGKHTDIIVHPDARELVSDKAQRRLRGETVPNNYRFKGIRKDGTTLHIEVSAVKTTWKGQTVVLAYLRDITERIQAEAEIARLAEVVEQSSNSIVITDLDGNIVYVNPFFEKLTGYNRDEVLGENPRLLKSDRHDRIFYKGLWETISSGETWNGIFINKRKDGNHFHEEATIFPIKDTDGKVINYAAVKADVTERIRAGRILKESEEKYRRLVENLRDEYFFYVHDTAGVFTYISPSITNILGYSQEEFLAHFSTYLTDNPINKKATEQTEGTLRGEVQPPYEVEILAKDGTIHALEVSEIPIFDENNRVVSVEGMGHDITERRKVREALQGQVHFLQTLLDAIPYPVIYKNTEGRYLGCNTSFETRFGFKREHIIGATVFDIMPTDLATRFHESESTLLQTGCTEAKESVVQYADGTVGQVIMNMAPYKDVAGNVTGLVGTTIDISDRKKAERELIRAKEEAEAASRSKSEFLANMSHEIRTPMNGVIGNTALALDTSLTQEQQEYLEAVKSSADHLLGVINDILDFSKIEAGRLDIEEIDFSFRSTVEHAVDTLAVKAHEKDLELVCNINPEVPDYLVGDPGRLRQIIVNLVGNAVKFTEMGEIVVSCNTDSRDDTSALLHIAVSDTGIGIAEDKQVAIFESFSQADGSTTRRYGGTGLGLSICKQLIELMGGKIWIHSPRDSRSTNSSENRDPDNLQSSFIDHQSKGGPGSTFHFTVRYGVQTDNQQSTRELKTIDIRDKRVLVVDDNTTNRMIIGKMLSNWGAFHDDVPDGQIALKTLKEAALSSNPYDLVLMDGQMPEMDGFEVTRRIKADPLLADTVIVILTSMGLRGDIARCREMGVSGHLMKPVKESELLDVIMLVLGGQEKEKEDGKAFVSTRHRVCEKHHHRRLKILLAEDNVVNQKMGVKILEKMGHQVTLADNGQRTIDFLQQDSFDLVLMDVQMPVMDGLEATRRIRETEAKAVTKDAASSPSSISNTQSSIVNRQSSTRRIPIIAMTANAMKGDREKCLEAGMDDYLSKPIDPHKLGCLLDKWKDKKDTRSGHKKNQQDAESKVHEDTLLDLEKALARANGDRPFLKEMLQHFIAGFPDEIDMLAARLEQGDWESLTKQAQSLKGAATTVGANGIATTALRLEGMGREGEFSAGSDTLSELADEFARLSNLIEEIDWSSVA